MNASQHPCPNLRCSKVFTTPQYLQRHRLKCKASEIGRLVSIHCNVASPVFLYHAHMDGVNSLLHLANFMPSQMLKIDSISSMGKFHPFGFTAESAICDLALWDLSLFIIM